MSDETMDRSEKLVEAYLRAAGYRDVKYEPDGNVPPDFLVDGRIAIEVRRLNQNHEDSTGLKGLEQVAIPLAKRMRKYLATLGAPLHGQSWFVFYHFKRPMPEWKILRQKLNAVLLPFMKDANAEPFSKEIYAGFELEVFEASHSHATFFVPAGHIDQESGGFLIREILTNLKICIAQKTEKISHHRSRYPTWWLILPDHIGYGLDEFERQEFREQASIERNIFEKIILIDPHDPSRVFEL